VASFDGRIVDTDLAYSRMGEIIFSVTNRRALMSARLEQISEAWNRLASEDPLWAVCAQPGKKGNRWDRDAFYATGEQEIATVLRRAIELGLEPKRERALDFGCGVGRLTFPLAERFDEVVGVDVSERMLALARAAAEEEAKRQWCRFVRNERADLAMFDDDSFDFVYSSMVLQHMPVRFSQVYLTDFIRVLKPGGIAVFHIPASTAWTMRGMLFRWAPRWVLATGQRLVLRYPAPMEMHCMPPEQVRTLLASAGARVLTADRFEINESRWLDMQYYARKGPEA